MTREEEIQKSYSRLHNIWHGMKQRCLNKNATGYNNYGGRGISICKEWLQYRNFKEWSLNNGYNDTLSIDRIDTNGNYEPNNCRFVDSFVQLNNTTRNVNWTDKDIWDYIHRHNLPVNPEYKTFKRVGCIVCPKANFSSNGISLLKYPKLIDAFIKARIRGGKRIVWTITYDGIDYSDDKPYYICRWLNHSFMPFSKKQEELYKQVREKYNLICKVNLHVNN